MRLFKQKNNIDSIFRKNLRDYKVEHSDDLWDKIQSNLDSVDQKRGAGMYNWIKIRRSLFTAAAVLFFIVSGSVFYVLNTDQNTQPLVDANLLNETTNSNLSSAIQAPITAATDQKIISTENRLVQIKKASTKSTAIKADENPSKDSRKIDQLATLNAEKRNQDVSNASSKSLIHLKEIPLVNTAEEYDLDSKILNKIPSALPLQYMTLDDNYELVNSIKDKEFTAREVRKYKENSLGLKGAYLGIEGQINNTWILTSNLKTKQDAVQSSLDENKTVAYNFSFTKGYGIRGGYDFNSRIGIESKILKNQIKQEYTETKEGYNYFRNTELNYIQIPLSFKYKWSRLSSITKYPMVMNYKIGLQYAYLTNATVNLNNEFIPIKDILRKQDMGLVAGIDYDIFFNPNSFVSIGTNLYYGSNLNAFPYLVSDKDQKTNNLAIGLNLSLNYKFHNKKK